ncbi:MAG: heme biosynthesis protein HemY [Gammaproteobacteria bacterium]
MRILFAIVGAVIAAVVIGVLLSYQPGYVVIAYGTTRIQFTLFVFLLIYVVLLLLGVLLWWSLQRFSSTRQRWQRRRGARGERRAAVHFTRGIVALAQGRLQIAERALERAAQGVLALPALLAAARAADHAGASDRRDRYLQRAADTDPKATPAVLITQAQFDLAHGNYERALAALQTLRREGGHHPVAERDLARVYAALGDYDKLLDLLPALANQPTRDPAQLEQWAATAVTGVTVGGKVRPADVLRRVPSALRDTASVRRALAAAYVQSNEPDAAATLLERTLKAGYDAESVWIYALLSAVPAATRLKNIENWLARYGEKDALLKAAGRVSRELELWGRAHGYLSKLQARAPDPETALVLGEIAEREGRDAEARTAYREGLAQAVRPAASDERRS